MVSSADLVLKRIQEYARRRWLPIIGPEKGRILADVIHRHHPKRILEVGTLVGYSAIIMGREVERGGEIITIEIDENAAETACRNIQEAGLSDIVKVVTGDAVSIIPQLDGFFDMVFLDAVKHQYLTYLKLVEDRLREGAVIVADNVGWSSYSMRDFLDHVRKSGKYKSEYISVAGDGMEISVKQ